MLSKPIRLALVAILTAYALFRLSTGADSGWAFLGASLLLAIGLYRHGSVWLAYQALIRGDSTRARALLGETSNPSRLTKQDRAYYHWVTGNLLLAEARHREAYDNLILASNGGLRTGHIHAATECALAEAALGLPDLPLARSHLARAQALPHRSSLDPALASLAHRLGSA